MSRSQSSSRLSRSLPMTAPHSKSKPKLSESKTARRLLAKQGLSKQQVPERIRLGDEYQSNAIAKLKLRHGATLGDSCKHRADPNWNPARDAEFLVGVQQAAAQHKKEHLDTAKLNRIKQRQQKTAQARGAANRVPFAYVGGSVDGSLTPAALLHHPKVGQCVRFYMQGPRFGTLSKPRKFPKLRSLIWSLHAAVRLKKGAGLSWRRLWVTDQSVMHMLYGGNETAMRSARRANRVLRRASLTGTEQATQLVSDDSEEEEETKEEKPKRRYAEEGLYGTKRTNLTERVLYGLKANDSEQRLRKKYEQPKKRVLKFVPDEYGVPKLDTDMLVYEEFQDMLADAKREAEALHVALGTNLKARGAVKGSQTSRALLDAERASMRPPEATVEEKQENIRRSTREINHMLSTMDRASQIMKQQHENKSVVDLLELQMKAFASVNAATASGHINMNLEEKPGLVRRYPANDPLHTSPKRSASPRKSKPRRHAKSVPSLQPRPISAQLRSRTSSNATKPQVRVDARSDAAMAMRQLASSSQPEIKQRPASAHPSRTRSAANFQRPGWRRQPNIQPDTMTAGQQSVTTVSAQAVVAAARQAASQQHGALPAVGASLEDQKHMPSSASEHGSQPRLSPHASGDDPQRLRRALFDGNTAAAVDRGSPESTNSGDGAIASYQVHGIEPVVPTAGVPVYAAEGGKTSDKTVGAVGARNHGDRTGSTATMSDGDVEMTLRPTAKPIGQVRWAQSHAPAEPGLHHSSGGSTRSYEGEVVRREDVCRGRMEALHLRDHTRVQDTPNGRASPSQRYQPRQPSPLSTSSPTVQEWGQSTVTRDQYGRRVTPGAATKPAALSPSTGVAPSATTASAVPGTPAAGSTFMRTPDRAVRRLLARHGGTPVLDEWLTMSGRSAQATGRKKELRRVTVEELPSHEHGILDAPPDKKAAMTANGTAPPPPARRRRSRRRKRGQQPLGERRVVHTPAGQKVLLGDLNEEHLASLIPLAAAAAASRLEARRKLLGLPL